MKINYKQSILGSAFAFVLATSCCWLPFVIIAVGGATSLASLNAGLEKYSGLFMTVGIGLLAYGAYEFYTRKNKRMNTSDVILESTITCPECGFEKKEIMPTNACQYFYECESCHVVLKPKEKDCCVYCSYATVPCPPIQLDEECCK